MYKANDGLKSRIINISVLKPYNCSSLHKLLIKILSTGLFIICCVYVLNVAGLNDDMASTIMLSFIG